MPIRVIPAMVHLRTSIRYSPHRQNCRSHRYAMEHLPIDGGAGMSDYGELRQSCAGLTCNRVPTSETPQSPAALIALLNSLGILSSAYKSLPAEGLAPHGTEDGGDGRM